MVFQRSVFNYGVHLTLVYVHSGVGGLCNTQVDEGGYIVPRYICNLV